ncbi:hypothetical protein PI124_g20710 [Phytophthora idaei]|nr:hypothetical protein PI124_g20710 [Phytophthora idaei]
MTIGQPNLPREPKGTRPADNRAPVPPGSSTTGRYAWIFWQLKHRRVAKPVSSRSIRCSYQVRQRRTSRGISLVPASIRAVSVPSQTDKYDLSWKSFIQVSDDHVRGTPRRAGNSSRSEE